MFTSLVSILGFLTIFLIVIFGAHGVVYVSLVRFFWLSFRSQRFLLVALILLSFSFIASNTLTHTYDNNLTRGLYYLAAVWTGVLSNLFFALLWAWIILGIGLLFKRHLPSSLIGSLALAVTAIVSLYGLWNADHPVVRYETVTIENLPTAWEGKRIAQVTDVHLGSIIRADFLERLVVQINEANPEIVCYVGDLFDGMDGHLEPLVVPLKDIHAPLWQYFVTGNHETYLGTGEVFRVLANTPVHIIDNKRVELDGLQLLGVAYPARGSAPNIGSVLKNIGYDSTKPAVLLYHAPTDIAGIVSLGVDLELTGHSHRGQLFPYNFVTSWLFHGYDYGLFQIGKYTLSASSGAGTWGPPMRTSGPPEVVILTLKRAK